QSAEPGQESLPVSEADPAAASESHRHHGRRSRGAVRVGRASARRPSRLYRKSDPDRATVTELSSRSAWRRPCVRAVARARRVGARREIRGKRALRNMILVTTGTNAPAFDRLLRAVGELDVDEPVVVQHGPSIVRPPGATCLEYISFDE